MFGRRKMSTHDIATLYLAMRTADMEARHGLVSQRAVVEALEAALPRRYRDMFRFSLHRAEDTQDRLGHRGEVLNRRSLELDFIRQQSPEVANAIEGYADAIRTEGETYAKWCAYLREFAVEDLGLAKGESDGETAG